MNRLKLILSAVMASVLVACGGGGTAPVPRETALAVVHVVPDALVQTISTGERVLVMPYRRTDVSRYMRGEQWVYMYDEVYWTGTGIQVGLDDAAIAAASQEVRTAGAKTMVSILPRVILDSNFRLPPGAQIDAIGIDIYPCQESQDVTALLAASMMRLRALGFTGEFWYIYQGPTGFPAMTAAQRSTQDAAIVAAPAMGVSGLVEFNY